MSSSLNSPMSNSTNLDPISPITSLEPVRRENAVMEPKNGQELAESVKPLTPHRRPEAQHPYQTPQSVNFDDSNQRWIVGLEQHPGRNLSVFIAALAVVALGLASYLTVPWFTDSKVVGCNGSVFNCASVLNSRYSNWLGLPVSGMAALTYCTLLVALVLAQSGSPAKRDLMWGIVAFCCLSAGAAALWFVFLQFVVLKHLCLYCLAAHVCGIVLAVTFLYARPLGTKVNTHMGILALVGLVFLSVGQTLGKEAPTFIIEEHPILPQQSDTIAPAGFDDVMEAPQFEDVFEAPDFSLHTPRHRSRSGFSQVSMLSCLLPLVSTTSMLTVQIPDKQDSDQDEVENGESKQEEQGKESEAKNKSGASQEKPQPTERRILDVSGGIIKLDVSQWPSVGNQKAEFVCVEMFDYNCQHCRQTHAAIKAAREKMGEKMAVILLPLPLNTDCNNQIVQTGPQFVESCLLSKLSVSVWKTNPEKFCDFHEWMFDGPNAPNYQTALAQAESMVGKEQLAKVLNSPLPDAYLQKHVQIYARIGKGNIPKLLFRTTSIEGLFQSPDLLIDVLNRQGPLVPTIVPAVPAGVPKTAEKK